MKEVFKIRRPVGTTEWGWLCYNRSRKTIFVINPTVNPPTWLASISALMEVGKTDTIHIEADHEFDELNQRHLLTNVERVRNQEW